MKFPVGSAQHADAFFHQVKLLNLRDGRICIFDSSVSRPMPMVTHMNHFSKRLTSVQLHNLKPITGGTPQGQIQGQGAQGQGQMLAIPQPPAVSKSAPLAVPLGNGAQATPYVGLRQGNVPALPAHRPPSPSAVGGSSVPAASGHAISASPQPGSISTVSSMAVPPSTATQPLSVSSKREQVVFFENYSLLLKTHLILLSRATESPRTQPDPASFVQSNYISCATTLSASKDSINATARWHGPTAVHCRAAIFADAAFGYLFSPSNPLDASERN